MHAGWDGFEIRRPVLEQLHHKQRFPTLRGAHHQNVLGRFKHDSDNLQDGALLLIVKMVLCQDSNLELQGMKGGPEIPPRP